MGGRQTSDTTNLIAARLRKASNDPRICGIDAGRCGSCNAAYTLDDGADEIERLERELSAATKERDDARECLREIIECPLISDQCAGYEKFRTCRRKKDAARYARTQAETRRSSGTI